MASCLFARTEKLPAILTWLYISLLIALFRNNCVTLLFSPSFLPSRLLSRSRTDQPRCAMVSVLSRITGLSMVMMILCILITISRQTSVFLQLLTSLRVLETVWTSYLRLVCSRISREILNCSWKNSIFDLSTRMRMHPFSPQRYWLVPFSPESMTLICEGYRTHVDYQLL